MSGISDAEKKTFLDFVKDTKVLIVDPLGPSRNRMAKVFSGYNVPGHNIIAEKNIGEAMKIVEKNRPDIVICEYTDGKNFGFDLFREFREKLPELKESVFILVTANTSQSAVAQAAEEDVDAFILKPFSVNAFEEGVQKAVINKKFPSDYIKTIDEGKEILFSGEPEKALEIFEKAIPLHPEPTLAHFYIGQAKLFIKERDEALKNYNKGLEFNKIHYKCLIGLFDILMEMQRYEEAYDIVKKVANYFPSNPGRLATVIRLAVVTRHFMDMEHYYKIFTDLEYKNDELHQFICAGLYVTGKYYFNDGNQKSGVELYEKLTKISQGKGKFLRAMVEVLSENQLFDDAQKILKRFSANQYESEDYLVSEFLAKEITGDSPHAISYGLKILNKDIKNIFVYKHLVNLFYYEGNGEKSANLAREAMDIWPHQKEIFQFYVENQKAG